MPEIFADDDTVRRHIRSKYCTSEIDSNNQPAMQNANSVKASLWHKAKLPLMLLTPAPDMVQGKPLHKTFTSTL